MQQRSASNTQTSERNALNVASLLCTILTLALGVMMLSVTPVAAQTAEPTSSLDTSKAYVVAESLFINISESGEATARIHSIVRVNSAEGDDIVRYVARENDVYKIKQLRGFVYDRGGKLVDSLVNKKQFGKTCGFGPEFALYADICYYYGGFKSYALPYTVEWEEVDDISTIGLWTGWYVHNKYPVLNTFCQIRSHPANNIKYFPSEQLAQSQVDLDGNTHQWSITNLAPLEAEPYEPWPSSRVPQLRISVESFSVAGTDYSGSDWKGLAAGSYGMMRGAFKTSDAQEKLVSELRKTCPGTLLDSLHAALSRKLRYVAIYLDMGGWVPHRADETFKLGYGDCKDLSMLYSVLLDKAGVSTHTALISTKNTMKIDPAIPTISQFNHVIMYYVTGGDTTWVDPTCFDCKLGDLPYSVEGLPALASDPLNGGLLTTPLSSYQDNYVCRNVEIAPATDQSAAIKMRVHLAGNPSHNVFNAISGTNPTMVSQLVAQIAGLGGTIPNDNKTLSIASHELSHLDLGLTWTVPRYTKQAGDTRIIDLMNLLLLNDAETRDLNSRKVPLEIGYQRTLIDSVKILPVEGYTIKSLPNPITYSSEFGDLSIAANSQADTTFVVRTLTRKQNVIDIDKFADYQLYRKELATKGRAVITLSKK